jgi:hypothetical protein
LHHRNADVAVGLQHDLDFRAYFVGSCDGRIGDYEHSQLATSLRFILLLNEGPPDFGAQLASLRQEGLQVDERIARTIGDDGYRASLLLVELWPRTP